MYTQQATVDAVSGLYQGDISAEEDFTPTYDYAIKQGNAAFLSIQQMIPIAEQILQNAKNKNKIKDIIQQAYDADKEKNKNKIRTEISEGIGNRGSKAFREYYETLT